MATFIDKIGPETLKRMKAIQECIEETGRRLGIPEDRAFKIVEIERVERMAEKIDAFQKDAERWRAEEESKEKKKFDPWKTLRNLAAGFVGEFDARYPREKK